MIFWEFAICYARAILGERADSVLKNNVLSFPNIVFQLCMADNLMLSWIKKKKLVVAVCLESVCDLQVSLHMCYLLTVR